MQINLIWDLSVSSAPADFKTDVEEAASIIESDFFSPITVNITVGWGEVGGQPITDPSVAEATANGSDYTYSVIRSALAQHAVSPVGAAAVASLPTGASIQGQSSFFVATAEAKALGLIAPNGPAVDGAIGFGTGWSGDNTIIAGALHELTHAIGRDFGYAPFDFYRFSSAGVRVFGDTVPAPAAYFSLDGGTTSVAAFSTSPDPGDFVDSLDTDPFSQDIDPAAGYSLSLSAVDIQIMDALGFDSASMWVGPSAASPSGDYATPANWSTGAVPPFNNAVLGGSVAYLVTADQNESLLTLSVLNPGAELSVSGHFDIGDSTLAPNVASVNDGRILVASNFSVAGTLVNAGTIKVKGDLSVSPGQITGSGRLKIGGNLELTDASIVGGTLIISQFGSIDSFDGSALKPTDFIDNGTIFADDIMKISAGMTSGSGVIDLGNGPLTIKGSCSLTVQFVNADLELILTRSQSYTGVIGFLQTGDQLDLRDIGFVSPGEAGYAGSSSGGTLTVSDGTHVTHLQLSGDYRSTSFTAASDGRGGTLVTYNPTTPAAHVLFAQISAGMADRTRPESAPPHIGTTPRSNLATLAIASQ